MIGFEYLSNDFLVEPGLKISFFSSVFASY